MRSRDYWQMRTQERYRLAEVKIFEAKRTLVRSFEQARRDIQIQIDAFYGRYARNNGLTLSEAQKVLSLSELWGFRDDLESFRKLAVDGMSTFNLELENLSVQARVTRLQALQCQIDAVVEQLYAKQRELVTETAGAVYTDQFHRTLFDIDQYTGFHAAFAQMDSGAVKRLLNYPFDGLLFSTRLWRQSEDLKPQIQQTVNRMLLTGKPPQDYAEEFAARFIVKTNEAYRLLYTENAFIANQAHSDSFREAGIKRYEFNAALEKSTCKECGALDGKIFLLSEERAGENAPLMHPFCRCVKLPVIEEAELGGMKFARDRSGQAIEVPADMTFEQWKEKFLQS